MRQPVDVCKCFKGSLMRWQAFLILLLTPAFARADDLVVERAVLSLIEHADVPAQQAGRIQELIVREGDRVEAGQLLIQLDDREARLAAARAKIELESARFLASDKGRLN